MKIETKEQVIFNEKEYAIVMAALDIFDNIYETTSNNSPLKDSVDSICQSMRDFFEDSENYDIEADYNEEKEIQITLTL